MQYLLTEDEYKEVLALREHCKKRHLSISDKKLGVLCVTIADTMPVKWPWGPGKETPMPWGCITTHEDWHCDECPVREICPLPHDYSQ
jgi:hypothetical protein